MLFPQNVQRRHVARVLSNLQILQAKFRPKTELEVDSRPALVTFNSGEQTTFEFVRQLFIPLLNTWIGLDIFYFYLCPNRNFFFSLPETLLILCNATEFTAHFFWQPSTEAGMKKYCRITGSPLAWCTAFVDTFSGLNAEWHFISFFKKMCGHLPNQSAPSVSSCVAAKGDDPVTAASLPTCREPSLSALRRRKQKRGMQLEVGVDACKSYWKAVNSSFILIWSIKAPLLRCQRTKHSHNCLRQAAF